MPAPERGEAEALDNNANNFSPQRRARYERRRMLWDETSLPRVKKCGRTLRGDGVIVRYREGQGAGFAGLVTCGSVWAEPVCNSKIMARRAFEIGGALAVWQMAGKTAVMVTLTMRHHRGQTLSDLWKGLTAAWHRVTGGKGWQADVARYGIAGWLRVVEVTIGDNGWHVHTHIVFLFESAPDAAQREQLHSAIFSRWSAGLVASGLGVPLMSGQDMRPVSGPADEKLAAYFTKAVDHPHRVGLEFTQSQTKGEREWNKTKPTWALLDLVALGDADALDLWHEYETSSKGKRQISWSQGLRQRLGLMAEQTDEQIAREEVGSANDDLVFITAAGWSRLLGRPAISLADVLTTTERSGLTGLRALLDIEGIEYQLMGEANAA